MQNVTATKDLVCGMEVNRAKAAGYSEYQGQTYCFCSKSCKAKFDADPSRYIKHAEPMTGSQGCALDKSPSPSETIASNQNIRPTAEVHETSRGRSKEAAKLYTCPMHPEVQQDHPGTCPKCGMALEPVAPSAAPVRTEYVCPMHPQIVRDQPGNCSICGMALEPRNVVGEEHNPELGAMTRRFWVSTVLTLPVFSLGMMDVFVQHGSHMAALQWVQLILATPVVLWGGCRFGEGQS